MILYVKDIQALNRLDKCIISVLIIRVSMYQGSVYFCPPLKFSRLLYPLKFTRLLYPLKFSRLLYPLKFTRLLSPLEIYLLILSPQKHRFQLYVPSSLLLFETYDNVFADVLCVKNPAFIAMGKTHHKAYVCVC